MVDARSTPAPRANLTSLPHEVISAIAVLLDRHSANALARTSRLLTFGAESGIWRELTLHIPDHFPVWTPPIPQGIQTRGARQRAGEPAAHALLKAAQVNWHRDGMKAIMARVLEAGDEAGSRHWSAVRSIRFGPIPGSVESMVEVISRAAGLLRKLEISGSVQSLQDNEEGLRDTELFAKSFLGRNIHFPSLTSLQLADSAMYYARCIPMICNAAPNLESLEVSIYTEKRWSPRSIARKPSFPAFERDTKLRRASLSFLQGTGMSTTADFDVFASVVEHSPALRQLATAYSDRSVLENSR